MHSDWKGPFQRRLQRKASERGRRMAKARWARDRARRDQLAALTAEQLPRAIAERIIRVVNELVVTETVIWRWESGREACRKKRKLLFS